MTDIQRLVRGTGPKPGRRHRPRYIASYYTMQSQSQTANKKGIESIPWASRHIFIKHP